VINNSSFVGKFSNFNLIGSIDSARSTGPIFIITLFSSEVSASLSFKLSF